MPTETAGAETTLSAASPTASGSTTDLANVITNSTSSSGTSRDVTFKPKPIKAQRHVENPILSYQKIPVFAFNSPKNPHGLSPFQPTGKNGRIGPITMNQI